MTDKHNDASDSPQVRDRRTPPAGILPKNAQAWILTGIAVVMIAVIALSGKNAPPRTTPPVTNAVVDPSVARIQEYQKRIEEQTRKLALEQAQVARSEQALGLASKASVARAAVVNEGTFDEFRRPPTVAYSSIELGAA